MPLQPLPSTRDESRMCQEGSDRDKPMPLLGRPEIIHWARVWVLSPS